MTEAAWCWDAPSSAQGKPSGPWLLRNSTAVQTRAIHRKIHGPSWSRSTHAVASIARPGNTAPSAVSSAQAATPNVVLHQNTPP